MIAVLALMAHAQTSPAAPERRLRRAWCSKRLPTRAACKATQSAGDAPLQVSYA